MMFLGFSKTLKKMGGFRLHLGVNLKKWYGVFILLFIAIFYLMYCMMLAALWCIYGVCWCFWKLGCLWVKLFKSLQQTWQKGALIGGTAVLALILAIVGGHAAKNQPAKTAGNGTSAVESVIAEETETQASETDTTTITTITTTAKPTSTTTTRPTTTTTTTTQSTTTTTTTQTTTRPTTERTTAPTVAFQTSSTYVLNTNTKRIHYPSCSSVGEILPENRAETDDYNAAIQEGYKPCGNCHPR